MEDRVELSRATAARVIKVVEQIEREARIGGQGAGNPHTGRLQRTSAVRVLSTDKTGGMYPARIVYKSNALGSTTTTEAPGGPTTTAPCDPCGKDWTDRFDVDCQDSWVFIKDADGGGVKKNDVYAALHVGTHTDGKPIFLHSTNCGTTTSTTTTSTTTTTTAPCSGSCVFNWDHTNKVWALDSTSCGAGCVCDPPQFCGTGPCDSTKTFCHPGVPAPGVCCPGAPTTTSTTSGPTTTTTPAPTTTPAGCNANCVWQCELGNWIPVSGCGGIACGGCSTPVIACNECNQTQTPCTSTTTAPCSPCGGDCDWYCSTVSNDWVLITHGCHVTCPTECNCVKPSLPCTVCNTRAKTQCFNPGGSGPTTTPGGPTTTSTTTTVPCGSTTTTAGPSNCYPGTCILRWNTGTSKWDFVSSNCPQCGCQTPLYNGSSNCDIVKVQCGPTTTSTTTTSTTTTSTTTTSTTTTSTTTTTTTTTTAAPTTTTTSACNESVTHINNVQVSGSSNNSNMTGVALTAGQMLVVTIGYPMASGTTVVSSVTWGASALTLAKRCQKTAPTASAAVEIWYLPVPATDTRTITVTLNENVAFHVWSADRIDNLATNGLGAGTNCGTGMNSQPDSGTITANQCDVTWAAVCGDNGNLDNSGDWTDGVNHIATVNQNVTLRLGYRINTEMAPPAQRARLSGTFANNWAAAVCKFIN